MRVGAIDIGTNSVRVLAAEAGEAAGNLDTLDRQMTITRLGQGVNATRRLHPDAVARTLDVLAAYGQALDAAGVERFRVTATSAVRDASNRADFLGPATEILGREPEVLSGAEEGRLTYLGATSGLDPAEFPGPYLVVDIGGGSTEFVTSAGALSVDIGCVRLTEAYLDSDPPTATELSQAINLAQLHLKDVSRDLPTVADARTLIGVAGTVTTVAAVELGLSTYDPEALHHFRLTRDAAEDVFRTLATERAADRAHNPGLEPARVDVIVGGCCVLVTVMRHLGADHMVVSEADILDGLVLSQI